MPEITVISGKGGTGKTSVAAAFARLAEGHVVCDLDVDAADLHLLLRPEVRETHEFRAGRVARINPDACRGCGDCRARCRFEAVSETADGFAIEASACEGCGVCAHFCPWNAIAITDRRAGRWFRSSVGEIPMIHAELLPGAENSGLLVSLLRREARAAGERAGRRLIIADGPPGIGCPVISAITGADAVALVTEPTSSGLHDLARAHELCAHFDRPTGVVLNKADLADEGARAIEAFCDGHGIPILARLPFDPAVVDALSAGQTMADLRDLRIATDIRRAWEATRALIHEPSTRAC